MEILRKPAPRMPLFSRRGFLTGAGAVLVHAALEAQAIPRFAPARSRGDYPFTLGVASGDPLPNGVVLWTRLAPRPLEEDGGMPQRPVVVRWAVAIDRRMRRVVRRGAALTSPELAHSVHVEVGGLLPSRVYWYQFRVGREESPVGRTRTAPLPFALPRSLSFAFASCAHYGYGLYPAYARLAQESLDFVVHLGDYIYEGPSAGLRRHAPDREIFSLSDYRIRHAQYKTDPALQAAHAAFPWIVTWDDHDTADDYAGVLPPNPADEPLFLERRAQAYQAYYEHMPLRARQIPRGPDLQLYRRLNFGRLAQFHVLDTRQYRSARAPDGCAAGARIEGYCPGALDATRTIQGERQRAWLLDGLGRSFASWNVLANQVLFAPFDVNPDLAARTFGGEKWDGYPFDRAQVLDLITARRLTNTVVITGDLHGNIVNDVPPDYRNLDAEPVATEFVGTCISTAGERTPRTVYGGDANNPHQRMLDTHNGYVRCALTPNLWRTDFRVVQTVAVPDAPVSTLASFVVERGRAGAQRA